MEYVLPWIASMQYGFKIAPPNLIATVISLIGSSEYIIGSFLESNIENKCLRLIKKYDE